MLIRIINGNYGLNNGEYVRAKTPKDPPFSVSDEEAKRLVELGIAEIVEGDIPGADFEEELSDEASSNIPEYDIEMTKSELQAIARDYGVEISDRASKSDIISALDEYFSDIPDLSAEV